MRFTLQANVVLVGLATAATSASARVTQTRANVHEIRQASKHQVIRSQMKTGMVPKRRGGESPSPNLCGTSSEFYLVAGDSDYHELTDTWLYIGGSTENHFAMLGESSDDAARFHLDSNCRLVSADGLVADAVWNTDDSYSSPLYFDTVQQHDDYLAAYDSDYGTCKAVGGQLSCTFADAAEISVCKDSSDEDPESAFVYISIEKPEARPANCKVLQLWLHEA